MAVTRELLGERLASARKRAGFTQEHIATFLGCTCEAVAQMKHGHRLLDVPSVQRLADLYGIELVAFLQAPNDDAVLQNLDAPSSTDRQTLHWTRNDLEALHWVRRFANNLDALNRLVDSSNL